MSNLWTGELGRLGGIVAIPLIGGIAIDQAVPGFMLGVIGYLGWHFYQLLRLCRHFSAGAELQPPYPSGLWSNLLGQIRALQVKSRKRKRRLARFFTRFREAATALPDAAVILGEGEELEWCNPAADSLLGLKWPRVAGQQFSRLLQHPVLDEYLADGDYSHPLRLNSPADKAKVLSLRITPFGEEGQHLVVARDITGTYHLDRVRRDFVANVSHELRTPLTVISGFLETMEDDTGAKGNWGQSIMLMRQQAKRMQDTINDLLTLSRLEMNAEEPRDETVPVARLLEGIMAEAQALSGKARHRFILEADPDLWLRGSKADLRGAFSNLIFNAVRHTPDGSEIRVRWRPGEEGALLSVSDTGEGIPARHIPRLSERFYRVDAGRSRQSGGTGLGLAIVKHVLNRHGSELHISSEEGKGSTFSCRFPSARITSVEKASK